MEKQEGGNIEDKAKAGTLDIEVSAPPYYPAQNATGPTPPVPPGLGMDGGKEEGRERSPNPAKEEEEDMEEDKNKIPANLNKTFVSASKNSTKPKIYFCGTPDFDETMREDEKQATNHTRRRRYTLQGNQWDKLELTWTLRTPSRHTTRLDTGTIRQQITAATLLWQKKSALRFIEVHKEAENIDIYVDFVVREHGDSYSFDGKGSTLAHAFYPGIGRGGDMHFDDEDNFVHHHQREKGVSLLITAAHELGHSLGK
ncbi:Matrix metalloproteinase-25 [Portunus trituberculatus]|uniref:Matrix metalloproteinase-25 n=1 Tax=Portunus trituberculatus TaxID=210409 RepID=A0A5B7KCZ8_PORTR|nr:Matrix metalloproteinase-25 [Portunus trituberculatus]